MQVFALEYASGGGCLESPAVAVCRAEGRAMLQCLATDLADVSGLSVVTTLDQGVDLDARVHAYMIDAAHALRPFWRHLLGTANVFWPVAPESDNILVDLVGLAENGTCHVLASDRTTIGIAASKIVTTQLLQANGISCVETQLAIDAIPPSTHGWVVKPDDGAGCENTIYLPEKDDVLRWLDSYFAPSVVIQPFIPGTPMSLSMLAQDGDVWLLTCNTQDVRRTGDVFSYYGGCVGGAEERRNILQPVAALITRSMPGLWGYIGVDLVYGDRGPVVLEVNPRLTTSYTGLRASIGVNPAALVLAMLETPLSRLRSALAPQPVRVTTESPCVSSAGILAAPT